MTRTAPPGGIVGDPARTRPEDANMHRNLERYLDLPESDRMTGGERIGAAT